MRIEKGKSLLIAGGVVALLIIGAIAALLLSDINNFKTNFEAAASETTGLEVRIKGKMGLLFFPFGVLAQDIHVTSQGGEIISLENLKLEVELLPLLKRQLKATSCELVKPVVTIIKDADGKYNFETIAKKSTEGLPGTSFSLNTLKLSGGVLVYLDRKTGEKTDLKDFNLSVKDLSSGNTVGDFIRNASFTGSVDCKELLQKYFRLENLSATVQVVKGVYSFEPLSIGSVVKINRKLAERIELKGIKLSIKDLSGVDTSGVFIKNLSFTGNMDCKEVQGEKIKFSNFRSFIKADKGVIHLKPFTMDIYGSKGEGEATLDMSEVDALYTINLKASKLDFEKFEQSYALKKVIGGKGDFIAALTIKEKGNRTLAGSTSGTFALRGANLVVNTMDLDKILSSYETSQEFNLVDLGAFFIAGPLGNVALKGYRYGDFYNQTRGGRGTITQFISHWKIKDGVAEATDCAIATQHNRIAFKGRLDFVTERYDNVIVALLDDMGCAKFEQSISGSFGKPEISVVSVADSLTGPFSNLYRKTKRFFQGGKCEVFYNGAVQHAPK